MYVCAWIDVENPLRLLLSYASLPYNEIEDIRVLNKYVLILLLKFLLTLYLDMRYNKSLLPDFAKTLSHYHMFVQQYT